jgi:uncharacterized sulfatase
MPHDPHTPPKRLLDLYRDKAPSIHIARYWAMVAWFDESIGQLMEILKSSGTDRNTIVAYVADNGWIQSPDNPRYAPRSKQSPYDGGLRTPIMIRWPDHIAPAQPDVPVSSIDLAPTLLSCAGFPKPDSMQGLDLRDSAALAARHGVFGACFTHNSMDLNRPAASLRWRWAIDDRWKLLIPGPNEPDAPVELFDIIADPSESKNLAPDQPETAARLRARINTWWDGN